MYVVDESQEYGIDIKIIGIGSSGNNVIDRIMENRIAGVEYIAVNTDIQALSRSKAKLKLQIGEKITGGLGTGGNPQKGYEAVEEDKDRLYEVLEGTDLVFITTGLGGGTGTGAAFRIAEIAKSVNALSVAVVTKPFTFEGKRRMRNAQEGLARLREHADTTIVIPNDRLLEATETKISLLSAFNYADNILKSGVQGILDLVTAPGLINLDFADIRTILHESGNAMLGLGMAQGDDDIALKATEMALDSPLLEYPINGATRVLLNITGGPDLTLYDVNRASQQVAEVVDPDANIIFGAIIDERLKKEFRVTVVATGFGAASMKVEDLPIRSATVGEVTDQIDIPTFLRKRE